MSDIRMTSKSSDGQAFWCSTTMPSRTTSLEARMPGAPSICTSEFAPCPAQSISPRGRWYLNEREKILRPPA